MTLVLFFLSFTLLGVLGWASRSLGFVLDLPLLHLVFLPINS